MQNYTSNYTINKYIKEYIIMNDKYLINTVQNNLFSITQADRQGLFTTRGRCFLTPV